MKKYKLIVCVLSVWSMGGLISCSDFEEVNTNPLSTGADKIKPYYSLSASIIKAQQNPDVAERLFVINWAASARQDGEDGYSVTTGFSDDGYNNASFNQISGCLTSCNTAITLCETMDMTQLGEHESQFFPNILQMARIWRAYLLSEFADTFGPAPLNGFQGEIPTFSSVKDLYYYLLAELTDAGDKINTSVEPNATEQKGDPAYRFDGTNTPFQCVCG